MSNILMFCNGIDRGPDPDFFYAWQKELAKGFETLGNKVIWIEFLRPNFAQTLQEALRDKIDFAFGFCWLYSKAVALKAADGDNILNKFNIPYVSWFMDPVFSPNNSALRIGGVNHLLCVCISGDEAKDATLLAPHVNQASFCPLGGTANKSGTARALSERKHRISFVGTYYSYHRKWNGVPQSIADILNDIIDLVLAEPTLPILDAVRQVLKAKNMSVSDQWFRLFCFRYLDLANLYIRAWCKREVVRVLNGAGIAIDVWGNTMGDPSDGWHNMKHLRHHGKCSYSECLDIIADSQLTLNVGMFPNGLHDRVTTAMLNGTIAVTDPSAYYHQNFVDGEDSICYDWKHLDELPHKIVDLLSDEDRMQAMADIGRQKALAAHTWTHRAQTILEQVQLYKAVVGI